MSGRWESLLEWLASRKEQKAQAKDKKPQPNTKLEDNIVFILTLAKNKSAYRGSGTRVIISDHDLRAGMVIDPVTMDGPIKARAASYGLYAGFCTKGRVYFYKI